MIFTKISVIPLLWGRPTARCLGDKQICLPNHFASWDRCAETLSVNHSTDFVGNQFSMVLDRHPDSMGIHDVGFIVDHEGFDEFSLK